MRDKFRELTAEELEYVAGGEEEIIITGTRTSYYWWYNFFGYGGYDSGGYNSDSGSASEPPPPADSDQHAIDLSPITRPLTTAEQAAIDKLEVAIERINNLLNALPPNATFRMSDGRIVTVAELQSRWSVTDFKIVDNNVTYNMVRSRCQA